MSRPFPRMKLPRLLSWLAAVALLAGAAFAQTPPPAPEPAAETPISLYGLEATNPDGIEPAMKLSGMPLVHVLSTLESLTGRLIVRPQALPTPEITFDSRGQITRRDAVLALETLLSLNGIAVTPMGEKFIKVVASGNVRTEVPELIVGSLRDRAPSGRIVSKLFRLQHLDLNAFQQQVQPFLNPAFGSFVPFQNTNTVLVTDTVANLQRLEYVIGEVDKPRNIVTKFYTLKFAQAQQVAEKIRSMIESTRAAFNRSSGQTGGGGGAPVPQPGQPMPPPAAALGGGGDSGISNALLSSSVSLNFDERTNQIILVSDPTSVPFFDNLIEKLDVQADPSTQIAVIQLQHANAGEIVGILSSFISGATQSRSSTAQRNTAQQNRNTRNQQTGLRNTFGTQQQQNQNRNQAQPNQFGAVGGLPNPTAAGAGAGERTSQFSEGMSVISDDRSNAIVASGTQDDLNLLRELIKQLDVVLPQVQIDVLIVSATLDDTVQRGIDLFSGVEVVNNKITKIGNVSAFGGGLTLSSLVPLGGGKFSGTGALKPTNEFSKVRVLSNPTITTTHNQQATIIVGDSVPIVTSSIDDATGSSSIATRNSYTYQDVGLQLQVTPLIGSDGSVQMQIDQSADEITIADTSSTNGNPPISRRQAQSFITVKDGEIIVLGGLQKRSTSRGRSGYPILSEIPLLGNFFSTHKNNEGRTEVMFFIQPHVLLNTDRANAVGQKAVDESTLKREVRIRLDQLDPDRVPNPAPAPTSDSRFGPRR